jgi:hypothetical protein
MSWQFLVTAWLASPRLLPHVIAALPAAKASLPCYIASGQPITLEQLLNRFVDSAEQSVNEIRDRPATDG